MTICSSGKNVWYSLITQSITCSLKGSGTKENNEWIPQSGSKWNLVFDHKSILDFATIYLSIWLWESHYFFFELKDNCFTEFCWFLPSTNVNRHRPPPEPLFLVSGPLFQFPKLHSKFPLAIYLKIWTASRICESSFHRGHANFLFIILILVDVLLKWAQWNVSSFIWKPGTLHSLI